MTGAEDLRRFHDAVKVTGMEKADWVRRAKDKSFKSTPEAIASQEERIGVFRELLVYLKGQIRKLEGGTDG